MTSVTETTMSANGQVTIPQQIRNTLGLKPGQKVWVGIGENQDVVIRPMVTDAGELFGMFKANRHISVEEMSAESSAEDDLDCNQRAG